MTQPDRALRLTFACEDREIRLVSHQSGEVDGARGVRVGGRTSAHYGHPHHRHRRAVSLRDAMMAATMILSGALETRSLAAQTYTAVVKQSVNLRPTPSSSQPAIRLLLPLEELRVLSLTKTNGYYNV